MCLACFLGVLEYLVSETTYAHTAARQESIDEADIEKSVTNRKRLLPSVMAGRCSQGMGVASNDARASQIFFSDRTCNSQLRPNSLRCSCLLQVEITAL